MKFEIKSDFSVVNFLLYKIIFEVLGTKELTLIEKIERKARETSSKSSLHMYIHIIIYNCPELRCLSRNSEAIVNNPKLSNIFQSIYLKDERILKKKQSNLLLKRSNVLKKNST